MFAFLHRWLFGAWATSVCPSGVSGSSPGDAPADLGRRLPAQFQVDRSVLLPPRRPALFAAGEIAPLPKSLERLADGKGICLAAAP